MIKQIHPNSLKAYNEIKLKLGARHRRILQIYHIANRPLTDREVKQLGRYDDMNEVRPRITELADPEKFKRLVECGKVRDVITKKMVRQTRLRRPEENLQPELF